MIVKERNQYFDNLKGFLIILVVVGNTLELANPESVNIHFFVLALYVFHMPLFVFLSGYFSKLSKRTTVQKVKSSLKIYLYAQVFYTAFNFFVLGKSTVKLQLLMPQWTLWYLLSMIFWYIISDYVGDYKKWIIWSVIISILAGLDGSIGTTASSSRTLFFLPFFIGGMAFKEEYINILRKKRIKILIGAVVTMVILWYLNEATPIELLFEYTKYTWYFDKPWFPMFLRTFHYISAIFVGMVILIFIPSNKTKLAKVGEESLIIYLTHSGIAKVFMELDLLSYNSLLEVILSTIIIVLTVIAVTFIYVHIRNKKSNKII